MTDLFAVDPTARDLVRLDARLREAIARHDGRAGRRGRGSVGRRSGALLMAAAVAIGAAAPLGLYDGVGAGFEYGFSVQMARSVALGVSAVDDGYRVTIDRGYLDGERLMLAVRVVDELRRPEVTQLMAMYSVVSDEHGVWEGVGTASSHPIGPWAATQAQWRVPPAPLTPGKHAIHVSIPHIFVRDGSIPQPKDDDDWSPWREQPGDWAFDIELPVQGGAAVAHPGSVAEIDGARLTLEEVVIGPTGIRVTIRHGDPDATWTIIGSMRRDGLSLPFNLEHFGTPGVLELQTTGGTDHASGHWTMVIDRASRATDDGDEVSFDGPWELGFDVP